MTEYGLIIKFPDQSKSFVHGYEMGMLAQKMQSGDYEVKMPFGIHNENIDLFKMLCGHYGYKWELEPYNDTYTNVKITKGSNLKVVK